MSEPTTNSATPRGVNPLCEVCGARRLRPRRPVCVRCIAKSKPLCQVCGRCRPQAGDLCGMCARNKREREARAGVLRRHGRPSDCRTPLPKDEMQKRIQELTYLAERKLPLFPRGGEL